MTDKDEKQYPSINVRSIKPDQSRNPDIQKVDVVVLKEGPRSRKEVVRYAITSRNTGEFKGNTIGFRTKRLVGGQWQSDATKSFTLENDEEVKTAVGFILASCGGNIPGLDGHYVVLPTSGSEGIGGLQRLVTVLSQDGKTELLANLLEQTLHAPELLRHLMDKAAKHPELFKEAAATLNLARYRQAYEELLRLIDSSEKEQAFQRILTQHPWMFGSEYSEHLKNKRILTRGAQQDFILRRTADGYIEVVEIKTPLNGKELFRFDGSHNSHYAGADLSAVIGQVQKYIEDLDAGRYEINMRDREDTNKIRAKVIIGRDGDADQQRALRRFNGHLHRIEVLTFDQLSRIALRTLSYLEELVPQQDVSRFDDSDEIPF